MSFAGLSLIGDASEAPCSASPVTAAGTPVMDSGYHLLLIQGYSRIKDTPNGECLNSQRFNVGGYSWSIEYYPNGLESNVQGYISLYLQLEDDNIAESVMVQFEFSFIDQVEKQESSRIRRQRPCEFHRECIWGCPRFMKTKNLERSKHLKNDSFMIRCDIVVVASSVVVPPPSIQQHLGSLLQSGEGADVTFKVGDETFMAHRCVLAARSPVFKAELFGPMKEGTTTTSICIDDKEPEVFKLLLRFIYSDSVPHIYAEDYDEAIWQHLFVAADIYDLPKLRLICEERLYESIDSTTATTILALAEQHHCQGLMGACLEFLNSPAEQ